MNKRITQSRWLATMFLLVVTMVVPSMAWAETITPSKPSNGDGSMDNPYQISNAEELYWFAGLVNGTLGDVAQNTDACAELTQDITVNEQVLWDDGNYNYNISDPITWNPIMNYNGTFDGKGHTISGLLINNYNSTGGDYFGFFGFTTENSEIRNLGIVDSYFYDCFAIGGVCGTNRGTIKNCYNKSTIKGKDRIGGVCGDNFGTITNCYNSGKVTILEGEMGGGVCGTNSGTIKNCYNLSGTVTYDTGKEYVDRSAESKTAEQFASGEVCYLLNGSTSKGTAENALAWYQNLTAWGDASPVLTSTGENTVYGAYKHGETSPTCSNSESDLAMFHTHAYDSSATDEASGNHDMSYEQEAQNPCTWTDIDNYSNATAQCNFICSVCNREVAKDMTVTLNEERTNVPAKCMDKGYNYYVASLTFNGTTYTEYYTQEVPALGHDDSGDVTFNSGESIYEKHCNRDGCDELVGYYATSDGMVEATYEDGGYKVPIFCLNDGLAYNSKALYTVESLEYKRMYYDDKWAAVYVPFAIDCSQLPDFMEMAVINNFHEYEQEDGSYNVVLEVKRKTSGTIPALTPCVMRLKEAPLEGFETLTMRFSNAMFSPAADKYIDCSSVTRYYKFSGSLARTEEGLLVDGRDFVLNAGKLYKANEQTVLLPQRWYLSAEDRAGSSTSSAAMLRSISINVIGDSDGDVTGIDDIHVVTEKATSVREGIFDLQGRRLNSEPTKGMYIKNGIKYVK